MSYVQRRKMEEADKNSKLARDLANALDKKVQTSIQQFMDNANDMKDELYESEEILETLKLSFKSLSERLDSLYNIIGSMNPNLVKTNGTIPTAISNCETEMQKINSNLRLKTDKYTAILKRDTDGDAKIKKFIRCIEIIQKQVESKSENLSLLEKMQQMFSRAVIIQQNYNKIISQILYPSIKKHYEASNFEKQHSKYEIVTYVERKKRSNKPIDSYLLPGTKRQRWKALDQNMAKMFLQFANANKLYSLKQKPLVAEFLHNISEVKEFQEKVVQNVGGNQFHLLASNTEWSKLHDHMCSKLKNDKDFNLFVKKQHNLLTKFLSFYNQNVLNATTNLEPWQQAMQSKLKQNWEKFAWMCEDLFDMIAEVYLDFFKFCATNANLTKRMKIKAGKFRWNFYTSMIAMWVAAQLKLQDFLLQGQGNNQVDNLTLFEFKKSDILKCLEISFEEKKEKFDVKFHDKKEDDILWSRRKVAFTSLIELLKHMLSDIDLCRTDRLKTASRNSDIKKIVDLLNVRDIVYGFCKFHKVNTNTALRVAGHFADTKPIAEDSVLCIGSNAENSYTV